MSVGRCPEIDRVLCDVAKALTLCSEANDHVGVDYGCQTCPAQQLCTRCWAILCESATARKLTKERVAYHISKFHRDHGGVELPFTIYLETAK